MTSNIKDLIIEAGRWSTPKEVMTKAGKKLVQSSPTTQQLSVLYKKHKEDMKAVGFSYSKDREGNWSCNLWSDLSENRQEEIKANIEASRASNAMIDIPVPDGLALYPFQKAGVSYMANKKGILLADEMGLGKTLQVIGFINMKGIKRTIIVAPKSLLLNWKRELEKWLTDKTLTIGIVNGEFPQTDIVIINYDGLRKFKEEIKTSSFELSVLDEAHFIKNSKTQRSILAKSIKAEYKIRITGTPIVNRPIELFNIVEDLSSEFSNFWGFAKRYCGAHQTKYGWDMSGATNLKELQERLRASIMVRRLKSEVLTEMPAKVRQVVELKTEGAIKKQIEKELAFFKKTEEEKEELAMMVQMAKLSDNKEDYNEAVKNLRQHNEVGFTEISRLRHETAVKKIPMVVGHVKDTLEDDNEKKVIVACHHKDVLDGLVEGLAKYNPVFIDGSVSSQGRQDAVDRFQNDESCRVFVGSIQAAGTGITLTRADWVVFAELDWVPGNMSQMEDRAHRIGQDNQVLIQHLVLDGSIDARLAKTIVEKQIIIDKALNDTYDGEDLTLTTETIEKSIMVEFSFERIEKEVTKKAKENGVAYTNEQKDELLEKIKYLAGMDGDMATTRNGMGFNKMDTHIGHALANQISLSDKQAFIAEKLVKKYRRQF